ncbi:MAG TPA: SMI1/KNR4 family protein, partial [Blastocatellia bacterium]|nr:SMI1/KNR4 family protein [Blastocatellia bacterium]
MNSEFEALFGNFLKNPGADEASTLATYHSLGLTPPDEYLAALQLTDGGEGFIGPSYFHLYATSEIVELNEAYQVNEFAPGLIVFGSSGGGEAYAFDAREAVIEIVKIPFIPMDFEFAERLGASFLRFLYALRDADNEGNSTPQIRMSA